MPDVILPDDKRTQLDGLVSQMTANGESEDNIRAVVEDFKQKYGSVRAMNTALVNKQPVDVADDTGPGALVSHFAQQVNPVPIGQLVPFPQALGGAGFDAPLKAAHNVLQAQGHLFDKAQEAYKQGDYVGAVAHAINWLIPVLGPVLDKAGEEMKAGKFAAGTGDTLGLSASLFGPQAWATFKETQAAGRLAEAAEQGAQRRAVETMAPQVGPNKARFGNMAADVGPDVLRQTTAVTRGGMLDQAANRLEGAYSALDAAYDNVAPTRQYPAAPVIAGLQREIQNLTVQGSGGAVEPANRAARIASLRQAIAEINSAGPTLNLKNLRNLRMAWDEGAKAVFTPSVAADYLKARGAGAGWADARSVLNDFMVSQHPELGPLNADASMWKKAVDVMQAAEEADQVRPKVGRSIMARGLGAAAGAEGAGAKGAVAGAIVGPMIERGLANLSPTMKIVVGRRMADLADAIRAGQTGRVQSLSASLQAMLRPLTMKTAQVAGQPPMPLTPAVAGTPAP